MPSPPSCRLPLSAPHALLLRACLGDDRAAAVAAWEGWRAAIPFAEIDYASRQLVPLLHHNLRRHGVDDTILGKYRGIRRRAWYENQRLFRRTAVVIGQLRAAGIPSLLLKGVALAQLYYPDSGVRPMSDADLLVPYGRAPAAIRLLFDSGWKSLFGVRPAVVERNFGELHSVDLVSPDGLELDLHWQVLKSAAGPAADEPFWAAARPIALPEAAALTLAPEDHFLHLCEHGVPWNRSTGSIRWIADATMLLRQVGAAFDWDRALAQSERTRSTALLAHACATLDERREAAIPAAVVSALAARPIPAWERREYLARTTPHVLGECRYQFWHGFIRRRRMAGPESRRPLWRAYPRYLCGLLRCAGAWEIPLGLGRRSAEISLQHFRRWREARRWRTG